MPRYRDEERPNGPYIETNLPDDIRGGGMGAIGGGPVDSSLGGGRGGMRRPPRRPMGRDYAKMFGRGGRRRPMVDEPDPRYAGKDPRRTGGGGYDQLGGGSMDERGYDDWGRKPGGRDPQGDRWGGKGGDWWDDSRPDEGSRLGYDKGWGGDWWGKSGGNIQDILQKLMGYGGGYGKNPFGGGMKDGISVPRTLNGMPSEKDPNWVEEPRDPRKEWMPD